MGMVIKDTSPAALPLGKTRYPIVQETGWVTGTVRKNAQNFVPQTGFDLQTVLPVSSRYTD
jgi:hypothetical protein